MMQHVQHDILRWGEGGRGAWGGLHHRLVLRVRGVRVLVESRWRRMSLNVIETVSLCSVLFEVLSGVESSCIP